MLKACTKLFFLYSLLFNFSFAFSQVSDGLVAKYSFNNSDFNDDVGINNAKAVGAALANDRFGNAESACFLQGCSSSYLNLGTSSLLKPKTGSISLWFNIDNIIEAGNGYEINPLILTKRNNGDDFYEAYCIYFMCRTNKISGGVTQSEFHQVGLHTRSELALRKWHHVAITFDREHVTLYIDGKWEAMNITGFEPEYLKSDSVMVGSSANTKNKRYLNGTVDDILFYNRVLSSQEIALLYNSPDPNRYNAIIKWVLISGAVLLFFLSVVFFINSRYKKALRKEIEKNELKSKVYETEIKVLKANMNPHFIFNALNSIQKYVLANDKDMAYKYLSKFSKLLRKVLESNIAEGISLEEEVEMLTNYLEMESLRFGKAFIYSISVDIKIDVSRIQIPHMLVQPFIENAIWHGLLHKTGDKKLTVNFEYVDEKRIRCIVDDNGVGREETTPEKSYPGKRSLAIAFNRERLELLKNIRQIDCGFTILDKIGVDKGKEGTRVNLLIPVLILNQHA